MPALHSASRDIAANCSTDSRRMCWPFIHVNFSVSNTAACFVTPSMSNDATISSRLITSRPSPGDHPKRPK